MSDTPADQLPGAPHPRETLRLLGQSRAEEAFLEAYASGRNHHAWLLSGPRGIGKATLAWRIARFLIAAPSPEPAGMFAPQPAPRTLDIAPDHPVARRIYAGSDPGLATITRSVNEKTGKLRDVITVDDIRRLTSFFGLTAADGGHRVVILDAADEMNPNAANALLKTLEEPPRRATLLLIAHQPSRLLPTIRSRCRTLPLSPLGADDLAAALAQTGVESDANPGHLAELSAGSVGAALRLIGAQGLPLYAQIIAMLGAMPRGDRADALALAGKAGSVANRAPADLLFWLCEIALARLARTGAAGAPPPEAAPGEAAILTRLSPGADAARAWAQTAAETRARAQQGLAVNLDPGALVLDTVSRIKATARRAATQ